jgi:UDP-3-O-[3-hydroxymyristoyl] glucosamine N-acyltransferase
MSQELNRAGKYYAYTGRECLRCFYSLLLEKYNTIKLNKSGIEQPSFIHSICQNRRMMPYIGAFTYISQDVVMGNNCKIYPGLLYC